MYFWKIGKICIFVETLQTKRDMTYSEFHTLIAGARSVRRFDESRPVGAGDLRRLVELVRYCPSGRNMQPLKYYAAADDAVCGSIFPLLSWAGYMPDWDGPAAGERPRAYLVQCLDTALAAGCMCDDGLQLEALVLGARTLGLSTCIVKAFDAKALSEAVGLPESLKPLHVVAIGYGGEEVVVETTDGTPGADIRYWRTPDGVHHVPKRPLDELIIN